MSVAQSNGGAQADVLRLQEELNSQELHRKLLEVQDQIKRYEQQISQS